jgi:riboflavin kinase/FMN adenylyltransferase
MNHVYNLADIHLLQPSIVTIGVFDGVHRGHQYLIRQLVARARAADCLAVVLTFFPHPDTVLRGLTGRYYLTTAEQRAAYLIDLGVDTVVTHPFDETTRQMRAADFVDLLVNHLRVGELWVGADFAMGYGREGDVPNLTAQGRDKGFSVHPVELLQANGDAVAAISSTLIREALAAGEVERAAGWLGRGYTVIGPVVHGQARGRTIGFPTANIQVWEGQVIPANGVYAGWMQIGSARHMAVTNIGVRPTFDGDAAVTIEAHVLDFNGDLYGREVALSFERRLRGEQRFPDIQALINQIRADVEAARNLLEALSH